MDKNIEKKERQIPVKYVFTGYYKGDRLISKLEPVTNLIAYSNDTTWRKKNGKTAKESLSPWKTDKYGVLKTIEKNFIRRSTGIFIKNQKFIMPPMEVVSYAAATAAGSSNVRDWTKMLGEIIRDTKELKPIEFTTHQINFEYLRKPRDIPVDGRDTDAVYREWYERQKASQRKIYGIIIPKTRAVFFVFHSNNFLESMLGCVFKIQSRSCNWQVPPC